MLHRWLPLCLPLVLIAGEAAPGFAREIRPLLGDHCLHCHGPDARTRKAKLRLDIREGLFGTAQDGPLIVPGDPARSALFRRLVAADADERMPPAKHNKALSPAQIDVVKRWIAAGARWEGHWAFAPPQRPTPPEAGAGWARNPIDRFVAARLAEAGLKPSPEAPRETQLRRLSFDVTGLPPTPEEIAAFVADQAGDAYERAVDRLLASPRHGERMALLWMDLARYADTNGYNNDGERPIWPWRDWLIAAFNADQPYDAFIAEQIAGDLLPGASTDQIIATGFGRSHVINTEGGAIDEEYRVEYVADRVHTVSSVLLGLSIRCARCHDHKYDPVSQREFFQLYAYFNSVDEKGIYPFSGKPDYTPVHEVRIPDHERRLAELAERIAAAERAATAANPDAGPAKAAADELKRLREDEKKLRQTAVVRMPVMRDAAKPRPTRILERGEYDKPGEVVEPGVPSALGPMPPGAPANRLGLARWLTAPANPLVARVEANRLWEMVFGTGLVETSEDFGVQGALPSHPELLDWLACELRDGGWSRRRLLRLILTSATYRQSSSAGAPAMARDPGNRLLARGPRFRLPAEAVRDNALAVSGLLRERIGGPSVKPYQPAGLWEQVTVTAVGGYKQDAGEALWRRSLYTYWKRTCPPPAMAAFDAPNRETCTIRRSRTNTPLQALALMNDPTFVEAARVLAERMMREGGTDPAGRLERGWRLALGRTPSASEGSTLLALREAALSRFRADAKAAERLLAVGERRRDGALDAAELAAWATVASVILGLDEFLTKE